MEFIKLNCPNCNGKIDYKEDQSMKCPFCGTEIMLKENKVYYVDQTINNYYGTTSSNKATQPKPNLKALLVIPIVFLCAVLGYFLLSGNHTEYGNNENVPVRKMPESEVLLFFLKDIFDKGEAMPTKEELASIRYLKAYFSEDQWHFDYSLEDPFTNKQAEISNYIIKDKLLNTQKIEQKDFEAFTGLTVLNLMGDYEISQSEEVSFRHLEGLKSYTGRFNESFSKIAEYFSDKSNVLELSVQIRSNDELALLLSFPNLQSLEISYHTETVTDFPLLNKLPLKSLTLRSANDLKWLSSLTDLESLTLDMSEATDFSSFYSLNQLQELKLTAVKNLKTLDFIQNMPNLQSLDLENMAITNLERLRDKSSLTKLRLSFLSKLELLDIVNSLTSLTDLSITGYHGEISSIVAPHLKKAEITSSFIPKLEAPALKGLTVYISGAKSYLNGAELLKYPQLEQLTVMESGDFTGIRSLNRLPKLQTINLNETDFYEETSEIFNLQHVKILNCNKCKFQMNSKNSLNNNILEHLTLNDAYFRIDNGDWVHEVDKIMPYFAGFSALRSFTLQDSSLQSLSFMEKWQQIEVLHLENNAISNVEPLVNLPNLKKLYILGNQVQNKSVLDKGIVIY
ncbi:MULTISPECIES: leucine-rich repeat domain-containing protein [unclassified Lysinibacillus]|uniref:leucine-rich repeat domain-containing protein n=1 Tax=unclassified Lysinibacillus TaxID=2636778 RepID=UPI002013A827|nr:leucine-rich repeat domain-containing protein [Lysinibacillus sp. BPa_S21]MCL1697685.1 leucine-rich repeat domain-containing protein [Lysinibacillus sp. BPa_S21]MCL1702287.1 leucine-rich repeat domain-containing protein [Lysinibacillus sp. Bpr_S20]